MPSMSGNTAMLPSSTDLRVKGKAAQSCLTLHVAYTIPMKILSEAWFHTSEGIGSPGSQLSTSNYY